MFGLRRTSRSPANPVALLREPGGRAAVDLAKVHADGHINLAKAADAAGAALAARGLAGIRAQAVLVLDHSGSMAHDYRTGAVQQLVERVLGFALQVDEDGTVPVVPFDHRILPTVEVTVANYSRVVNRQIWQPHAMGSTNLAGALETVRDLAAKTRVPLYAAVVTDGDPDDMKAATKLMCDLARYPVFLKLLALREVPYLSTLDTLGEGDRLLDNCNAQPSRGSGLSLLRCTDEEFQAAMAEEWDRWTKLAFRAGVLL